jgi:hypothetical protein
MQSLSTEQANELSGGKNSLGDRSGSQNGAEGLLSRGTETEHELSALLAGSGA